MAKTVALFLLTNLYIMIPVNERGPYIKPSNHILKISIELNKFNISVHIKAKLPIPVLVK